MPSRAHTFVKVLATILPQVERLFVYLDKGAALPPDYVDHPKIVALAGDPAASFASSGKFLGLERHPEPCLYFCFDDDLLYPPNYVDVLTRTLARNNLQALVAVHGAFFQPPYRSFLTDRKIFHFSGALSVDCHADILGTGTLGFYSGNFRVDIRSWPYHDMDDLMIAIAAVKQGLPRILIRRPQNYVQALESQQPDSVYRALTRDDLRQSEIMRDALDAYPRSWHRWGFEAM